MEFKDPVVLQCPFCGSSFEEERDWAATNERVMCTCCCKAFNVKVKSSTLDKEPSEWYKKYILGETGGDL